MGRRSWLLLLVFVGMVSSGFAADWPMWRHDAGRSGVSPTALPKTLHLHWVRELPEPKPAWPASQTKLQFDRSSQPVVQGHRLFVGSTVNNSIAAYETKTGNELWRFYTEGPVRFAPVAANGNVYAVSDDGHLYCLDAATGSLRWKVNGGPAKRLVIGNDRLVSTWPARGGVVLADDILYFTASIWPSMGIFIHAVDAETGKILWTNSETGSLYTVHPHGAESFGSIVPQGYLAVAGDYLVVPGGRSLPAVFNRKTGQLVHFDFGGKSSGGFEVMAAGDCYWVGSELFQLKDGLRLASREPGLMTAKESLAIAGRNLELQSLAGEIKTKTIIDRKGKPQKIATFTPQQKRAIPLGSGIGGDIFCRAGDRIYLGGKNQITAIDVPQTVPDKPLEAAWTIPLNDNPSVMFAADDRLFVVTENSKLSCYGAGLQTASVHNLPKPTSQEPNAEWAAKAKPFLEASQTKAGYALALGIGSGGLIEEILAKTDLQVIAVDSDAVKLNQLRSRMDQRGLNGTRLSAFAGDPVSYPLPPYFADLIVMEDQSLIPAILQADSLGRVFQSLRPYGGVLVCPATDEQHNSIRGIVEQDSTKFEGVTLARQGELTLLRRPGALPGAGEWTHQYGDAANSVVSKDQLVKAPLGVLWFGGPSNDKVLPRHGHGPSPQVAGGRSVIEGPDMLRAVDVYTGRVHWEKELPGVGDYYDVTKHFSGAGEVGSNYVTLSDKVYVIHGSKILELNAATGETVHAFELPAEPNQKTPPAWGFLASAGNRLVAASSPVKVSGAGEPRKAENKIASILNSASQRINDALLPADKASSSKRLVVYDARTRKQLWSREAVYSFRHNAIVVTADRVFCIDSLSPDQIQQLRRRGLKSSDEPRLLALDAQTGDVVWSTTENVFGTFLNYSAEHDVLLQAGSLYRDRAADEVGTGMIAYRASTGEVRWKDLKRTYNGPCLLWRDKIITNGAGGFQLGLLDGQKTGWKFSRMYGCNTVLGSEHLLTFRSGAAGFCDLSSDSGTGNLGGFRSSCTSNLIAADGVLSAPDFTRTCVCAYQNQTSVAWIHMPEADSWTFSSLADTDQLDSAGLNLGAPGDRRSAAGTLWFDYPSQGGPSPKFKVRVEPANVQWFSQHASTIEGESTWITSSGGEGLRKLTLSVPETLSKHTAWTVRLYFAEPDSIKERDRVFSIALQGEVVAETCDIAREAGGIRRSLLKEFSGIKPGNELSVTLTPIKGSSLEPILNGIEITPQNK